MTNETQRAEIIAQVTASIEKLKIGYGAARSGKTHSYVVYTGSLARVYVNEQAARDGKFSISVHNATKYSTYIEAAQFATTVRNGNGEYGMVCRLDEAYDNSIKEAQTLIAMLNNLV